METYVLHDNLCKYHLIRTWIGNALAVHAGSCIMYNGNLKQGNLLHAGSCILYHRNSKQGNLPIFIEEMVSFYQRPFYLSK
jgi:hypothetical protein